MFSWRKDATPSVSVCAVVLHILRAAYCFYSHCQMISAQSWDIFSIHTGDSGRFNHVNRHLDLGAEILESMFSLGFTAEESTAYLSPRPLTSVTSSD